jgi:serine/threonine protein kinase
MPPLDSDDPIPDTSPGDTTHPGDAVTLPGYHDAVLITRGDGSEVYRARQDAADRYVTITVLLLDDREAAAALRRAVATTARLGHQHPHIATITDTGTTPTGRPYLVMEYHNLGSAHDRLTQDGPLPLDDVITIGTRVADTLAYAHNHGVIHGNVTPHNILVAPSSCTVTHLGTAGHLRAAGITSIPAFNYRHAAPQVLAGAVPTAADDIWSLGSTLYTLLAGVPPFASDDPAEDAALPYAQRVRAGQRRPLTTPDVPPGLAAVIDRCLQHERSHRYPDAAAVRDALTTRGGAPPANPDIQRRDPQRLYLQPLDSRRPDDPPPPTPPTTNIQNPPSPISDPDPRSEDTPDADQHSGTRLRLLAILGLVALLLAGTLIATHPITGQRHRPSPAAAAIIASTPAGDKALPTGTPTASTSLPGTPSGDTSTPRPALSGASDPGVPGQGGSSPEGGTPGGGSSTGGSSTGGSSGVGGGASRSPTPSPAIPPRDNDPLLSYEEIDVPAGGGDRYHYWLDFANLPAWRSFTGTCAVQIQLAQGTPAWSGPVSLPCSQADPYQLGIGNGSTYNVWMTASGGGLVGTVKSNVLTIVTLPVNPGCAKC